MMRSAHHPFRWGFILILTVLVGFQATPAFAQAKLTIASFSSSQTTVPSGETFRLTAAYDCSSTTGNCLDGVITIPVPAGLTYL